MLIKSTIPLSIQVVIGVCIGTGLGLLFGDSLYLWGLLSNQTLGQLGLLVIRCLKTLATPLIFLAILEAILHTDINFKHAGRLFSICGLNLCVAMIIGLTIMNVFTPGESWQGHIEDLSTQLKQEVAGLSLKTAPEGFNLSFVKNLSNFIPETIIDPFAKNNIIAVILMALFIGSTLRHFKHHPFQDDTRGIELIESLVSTSYQVVLRMLAWIILVIPFAIAGVVAQVVGKSGIEVFVLLGVFLATLLTGLFIHSFIYYPFMASVVGKVPVSHYLGKGSDAILMGFSTNSSLATVPITLKCLTEKLGVSQASSRLAAIIGTNLNNDGIILYEAMTALFLAQAIGFHLTLPEQLQVIASSVMVGIGIAGIPEAGLIALPLVLGAIGLSENLVLAVVPLIATIDWIIARVRSVVNVMSDMLVAVLLDRFEHKTLKT